MLISLISKLAHNIFFTVPVQSAILTGSKVVSTRSSLVLNIIDKHLLIKIVQTGTKKSAVNISKLQGGKKAVEHYDLAMSLQRNQ